MSNGASLVAVYRQDGIFVDRVLKGAKRRICVSSS